MTGRLFAVILTFSLLLAACETVTPASLLRDDRLVTYFDGYAESPAGSWNVGSQVLGKSITTTGSIK